MKRTLLLILAVLLFASCTGSMKDIRIGKSYTIYRPKTILIYSEPHPDAETFYLDEAEAFEVVDAVCTDGVSLIMCGWDMATAMDNPEFFKVRWMKVRFETGGEGYINGLYFFPKIINGIMPEEYSLVDGYTAKEYSSHIRAKDRQLDADLARLGELRLKGIEQSGWSENEKQKVRDFKVWVGMTSEQLTFSQYPPPGGVTRTDTREGSFELWIYDGVIYELKDGVVIAIRWSRPPG